MFDRKKKHSNRTGNIQFLTLWVFFFFFSLCIQILSVREKKLPPTLLGSSLGDLEIKRTKDRLAREKMDFNHVCMEFTKKCDSKKQLEFGAYIPSVNDEKFYGNWSKRAWSAYGHSSDGLVVRWVGVSIISFQVQLVGGLHACGQYIIIKVNFSHLEGVFVFAKELKNIMCIYWWGNRSLPQGCSWRLFLPGLTVVVQSLSHVPMTPGSHSSSFP